MANCHKLFLTFNDSIALDSQHKKSLRISRNAVRKKIKNYFQSKDNGFSPKFHGQGSFMMNTIIEPLDGEFDIDDGIYFQVESKPSQSVSTFHNWICEAINGHTKEKPLDKQTCVRLIYAGKYHLDLPIYYIIKGQKPYLAHKGKGWIESDPREFIKWFQGKADKNGQLKRIVRYLKVWSDYRKGDLPSGLIFSILAANYIIFNERDDIAFYQTLCNINNHLKQDFRCQRPTTPIGENLLEDYSETKRKYFLERLENFIKSAENALDDEISQKDASIIWQRHFGKDRFPDGVEDTSANSISSQIIASYLNKEDDKKVLGYNDTEEFIQNYHHIDIRYDLKIDCKVEQNGFMPRLLRSMLFRKLPLLSGRKLNFFIDTCNVPPPYTVKWKVRNVGEEAIKRNQIRGQILSDSGSHQRIEHSNFSGPHFVECFVIKNNICVARDRIDVPIRL